MVKRFFSICLSSIKNLLQLTGVAEDCSYSWKSGRVDVSQSICCKLNPSCEIFQLVSELAKVLVEAA